MTLAPSTEDRRPAPKNHEELARNWQGYISWLGTKLGVKDQDIEDFTQEVLCTFISWPKSLTSYDPRHGSFATYLRGYVMKRCYSFRREAGKRARALRVSPDAPAPGFPDATYGDILMPADEDPLYAWIEFRPLYEEFLKHLEATNEDLHQVATYLTVAVVKMDQDIVRPLLADRLGISTAILDIRLRQLRLAALEWGLAPPEVEQVIARRWAAEEAALIPGDYLTA